MLNGEYLHVCGYSYDSEHICTCINVCMHTYMQRPRLMLKSSLIELKNSIRIFEVKGLVEPGAP